MFDLPIAKQPSIPRARLVIDLEAGEVLAREVEVPGVPTAGALEAVVRRLADARSSEPCPVPSFVRLYVDDAAEVERGLAAGVRALRARRLEPSLLAVVVRGRDGRAIERVRASAHEAGVAVMLEAEADDLPRLLDHVAGPLLMIVTDARSGSVRAPAGRLRTAARHARAAGSSLSVRGIGTVDELVCALWAGAAWGSGSALGGIDGAGRGLGAPQRALLRMARRATEGDARHMGELGETILAVDDLVGTIERERSAAALLESAARIRRTAERARVRLVSATVGELDARTEARVADTALRETLAQLHDARPPTLGELEAAEAAELAARARLFRAEVEVESSHDAARLARATVALRMASLRAAVAALETSPRASRRSTPTERSPVGQPMRAP